MVVLCKAEDARMKRPSRRSSSPEFTQDQSARERFFHEAPAASALEHTNICSAHELGGHYGRTILVIGFYELETCK
jgi:hypothetical protein